MSWRCTGVDLDSVLTCLVGVLMPLLGVLMPSWLVSWLAGQTCISGSVWSDGLQGAVVHGR